MIKKASPACVACPVGSHLLPDETHFLNALKDSIETGRAPADELIEKFNGEWAGDVTRVFGEYSY